MSEHLIFLSPHADDAVWACGGLIARRLHESAAVTVVTVFDGGEPAHGWRRVADPRTRRLENDQALASLGARGVSLGLADAAVRTSNGTFLYRDARSLRRALRPEDLPLVAAVAEALGDLAEGAVYAPLAAGGHVDHVIVRLAAELAFDDRTSYEDFPYPSPTAVPDHESWVEPVDVEAWLRAARLYTSQARALFGDGDALATALRRRAAHHASGTPHGYAQRLWRIART